VCSLLLHIGVQSAEQVPSGDGVLGPSLIIFRRIVIEQPPENRSSLLGKRPEPHDQLLVRGSSYFETLIQIPRQKRSDDLAIGFRLLDPDPLDCFRAVSLEILSQRLDEGFTELVSGALWATWIAGLGWKVAGLIWLP
jgi:hypothetical protein